MARPRRGMGACSGLARAEHTLSALDAGPQPFLEVLILLALGDVRADCGADDLGYGLVVDCRHGLEFVGLVSAQPNRHCLGGFHFSIMPFR